MSARMTVVFDDEALYRDAKVRAAETGVPLKTIIQAALRAYLNGEVTREPLPVIEWDWDAYDEWQRKVEELADELGADSPTDLSDIKHHLYGAPPQQRVRMLAEEPEPYLSS